MPVRSIHAVPGSSGASVRTAASFHLSLRDPSESNLTHSPATVLSIVLLRVPFRILVPDGLVISEHVYVLLASRERCFLFSRAPGIGNTETTRATRDGHGVEGFILLPCPASSHPSSMRVGSNATNVSPTIYRGSRVRRTQPRAFKQRGIVSL